MFHNVILSCLLYCISLLAIAEPIALVIDKSVKPRSFDYKINAVHKEMSVSADNLASVKLAILEGMLRTKGYKWLFEGEGEGYILARFDYRGDTNIMRIEYNKTLVQLKYHYAWGDYVCENLVDDICYKNSRGYYNYIKNLRKSISAQLNLL